MSLSPSYAPSRRVSASKTRLVEAGVRLFTTKSGAPTTREIAREAGVNHALISYHFNGVAELMDAVVERCIQDLRNMFLPVLEEFEKRIREAVPQDMPGIVRAHVDALFAILYGPQGEALLRALSRPESAALRGVYGRFSAQVLEPLHHSFALVAAKAGDIPEGSLESAVLAQCMIAQCMAFFRGARPVLAHLGKESFTAEDMREISRIAGDAVCRTAGIST